MSLWIWEWWTWSTFNIIWAIVMFLTVVAAFTLAVVLARRQGFNKKNGQRFGNDKKNEPRDSECPIVPMEQSLNSNGKQVGHEQTNCCANDVTHTRIIRGRK